MLFSGIVAIVLAALYFISRQTSNAKRVPEDKVTADVLLLEDYYSDLPANQVLPAAPHDATYLPEKAEDLLYVTSEQQDNTVTLTIHLNESELAARIENGTLVPNVKEVSETIEDIVGFNGTKQKSKNAEYCVIWCDGYGDGVKWKNGAVALLSGHSLLFKKKLQRPNTCLVSDNGIVACNDWLNTDDLAGKFWVFDSNGAQLFSQKMLANIGNMGLSVDGKIAMFETYESTSDDSNKIFIVDVLAGSIIDSFDRPFAFNTAVIDSVAQRVTLINQNGFQFEVDYEGNQTNVAAYEHQIMKRGSISDKLQLYNSKSDDEKFADPNYLTVLKSALKDKNASEWMGKDRLHRMLGECYYAHGEFDSAVESWENAFKLNPKVGVKKKLDALKKRLL